jgi:hypothetical protein
MTTFDREYQIFEAIRNIGISKTALFTGTENEQKLFDSIRYSKGWFDNSANTNTPPDYLNKTDGIGLEFMRINDYEFQRNFRTDVVIPDEEKYYANFARVFQKHDGRVQAYKENHPDCSKIVLAVCDISGYEQLACNHKEHPCDTEKFATAIRNSQADLVLWYIPFMTDGLIPQLVIIDVPKLKAEWQKTVDLLIQAQPA